MFTGGGCSSLEESLTIMGAPSLSKSVFIDIERYLGSSFEDYLNELMLRAGQEEKQIAKGPSRNLYLLSVLIVDGGWSKRAHGHSCNANFSGQCEGHIWCRKKENSLHKSP